LTIRGPYAHTRNPLYLGTLLLGTGIAVAAGQILFTGAFLVAYLLIYVPVMSAEAETMERLFPDEYADYKENVPLFLPRWTPYASARRRREPGNALTQTQPAGFDPSLFLAHREYRATFGSLGVYLLLIAKYYWLAPR
jgi:hypothetical protein